MTGHSSILILNCGSSSIKFCIMDGETSQYQGMIENIGHEACQLQCKATQTQQAWPHADHEKALQQLLAWLDEHQPLKELQAVGHRVVHGGTAFTQAARVNDEVIATIDGLAHLAPLHNPANLLGIKIAQAALPNTPQVAVFDTAFHQSMPPQAYRYAVPSDWYEQHHVRRFGFHGISHQYIASAAAEFLQRSPTDMQIISAHLGNGGSVCAIKNGLSVDTTMGLTPSEGIVMGTRSGNVDPGLHGYLCERLNMSIEDVTHALNQQSGLLGLSGLSHDMRTIEQAAHSGNEQAQLALDVYAYRLPKAIMGMITALDQLDAVVFTGGIGENAAGIRQAVIEHLRLMDLHIDPDQNQQPQRPMGTISTPGSRCPILVIMTQEEMMIAQQTRMAIGDDHE